MTKASGGLEEDGRGVGRRRRAVLVAAVALVLVSAAGVVGARWVRSPAQAAADVSAPARSVLTATVTRTEVTDSVVLRGTVTASAPVAVPVPAAVFGAGGESGGASRVIVSAVKVAVGDQVNAGQVPVEVSGRPVIVLPGSVPAYRDLRPGDTGADVAQLQQALHGLGLYRGSVDGSYGQATKAAVRSLYDQLGYAVPATSGLGEPVDPAVSAAQTAVVTAQRALADAEAAAPSPAATADPGGAAAVSRARQDLGTAQAAYEAAVAASGPMLPMSEVAFVPSLPARVVSLGSGVGGTPQTTVITLDTGSPVVVANAEPGQTTGLRTGMAATLTDEIATTTMPATIKAIGAATTSQDGTTTIPITLAPDQPLPAGAATDLKVVVDQASSNGAVLAVPIAAITARADGSTYVTLRHTDGSQAQVPVATGVVGDGLVEVSPTVTGQLAEGDQVVTSQ